VGWLLASCAAPLGRRRRRRRDLSRWEEWFSHLGSTSRPCRTSPALCRGCLDWSERQLHLAGRWAPRCSTAAGVRLLRREPRPRAGGVAAGRRSSPRSFCLPEPCPSPNNRHRGAAQAAQHRPCRSSGGAVTYRVREPSCCDHGAPRFLLRRDAASAAATAKRQSSSRALASSRGRAFRPDWKSSTWRSSVLRLGVSPQHGLARLARPNSRTSCSSGALLDRDVAVGIATRPAGRRNRRASAPPGSAASSSAIRRTAEPRRRFLLTDERRHDMRGLYRRVSCSPWHRTLRARWLVSPSETARLRRGSRTRTTPPKEPIRKFIVTFAIKPETRAATSDRPLQSTGGQTARVRRSRTLDGSRLPGGVRAPREQRSRACQFSLL